MHLYSLSSIIKNQTLFTVIWSFPGGAPEKETTTNAEDIGDTGSIPGGGNKNPFQYSCLKNPMDRDWQAVVHGVAKDWIQLKQFSIQLHILEFACFYFYH